ncbi:hypothetical protein [Nocardia sp. NPDC059239]|uniref:hypothetical protein n=1 Tax=unclassified Nocardia TaxID=2637762 RepID=UPI0036A2BEB1
MTTPPPAPPSGGQPDHHSNPPQPDGQWAATQQWHGQPAQTQFPPQGRFPSQQQFGQPQQQFEQPQHFAPGPGHDVPQHGFPPPGFGSPQSQFSSPQGQFGMPQGQFAQQQPFGAPGQFGAQPPVVTQPVGRNKNRMILVALAGVAVVVAGAVIAVVATRPDDAGGTQAQSAETSSAAATTKTGAGTSDPAAMVLAVDDLPVGWTEDTKKEQQTNDGTDEARVSGETPDCTAKLKKEAAPPATKPAAKATSAFAQKGGYGGASVATTVAFRTPTEIQSEFDEEKDASDNCPTVIYDGMQIVYTKISNIPAVGDEIIGYQMDATAAGGGQARGLHYVCRSGGKIWYFDYNANVNDYHADEANRLFTKALTKWQAGLK